MQKILICFNFVLARLFLEAFEIAYSLYWFHCCFHRFACVTSIDVKCETVTYALINSNSKKYDRGILLYFAVCDIPSMWQFRTETDYVVFLNFSYKNYITYTGHNNTGKDLATLSYSYFYWNIRLPFCIR